MPNRKPLPPESADYAPVFRVKLVREGRIRPGSIHHPEDAARLVSAFLRDADRETFVLVLLATNHTVIGLSVVSVGTLSATLVSPREVFKTALLANAAALIVAHNHPSGSLEPSGADVTVTKTLVEAGRVMDVPVHDHLIVGFDGAYTSLKERGLMP